MTEAHVVPRVGAGHLPARGEPGDFEVGVDRGVLLEVARLEHAEAESWRGEDRRFEHADIVGDENHSLKTANDDFGEVVSFA